MGWKRRVIAPLRSSVEVQPASPAIGRGLRAAMATAIPLAAGRLLGMPALSWVGFAGLLTTVAERGGSYGARAKTMGAVGSSCALAAALASILGNYGWVALPAIFVWSFAASMSWVWGTRAGVVGRMSAIVFAASLFTPAVWPVDALSRGALFLAGSVWSMGLALALWPFRPYQPARQGVGGCWGALAESAAGLAALARSHAGDAAFEDHLERHDPLVREALESARSLILTTRRGSAAETRRGERLVVLLEGAYRLAANLDAIAASLEVLADDRAARPILEASAASLEAFSRRASAVQAAALHHPGSAGLGAAEGRALDLEVLRRAVGASPPGSRALSGALVRVFERLADYLGASEEVAIGDTQNETLARIELGVVPRTSILEPIRDHLSFDSIILRHSLRVALIAAVSTAVVLAAHIEKGQWVVLSAIATLEPFYGATFLRGLQRVGGTLLGGAVAAVAAGWVHGSIGIPILVFVLTVVAVSLLPLNFALYYIFLTPVFLILAEPGAADWNLVGLRMESAAVGAALALFGMWLLWPIPEWQRIPAQIAAALRADDRHLAAVLEGASPGTLRHRRRHAGITAAAAEASFQRLLTEGHASEVQMEALLALVTYARRFDATITSISTARSIALQRQGGAAAPHAGWLALDPTGALAHGIVSDLVDSLERSRAPRELPSEEAWPVVDEPYARGMALKLERQVTVLHGAVSRLVGTGSMTATIAT